MICQTLVKKENGIYQKKGKGEKSDDGKIKSLVG